MKKENKTNTMFLEIDSGITTQEVGYIDAGTEKKVVTGTISYSLEDAQTTFNLFEKLEVIENDLKGFESKESTLQGDTLEQQKEWAKVHLDYTNKLRDDIDFIFGDNFVQSAVGNSKVVKCLISLFFGLVLDYRENSDSFKNLLETKHNNYVKHQETLNAYLQKQQKRNKK